MSAGNTIEGFVQREGLSAEVEWADSNPNMAEMPSGSTHWLVTIRKDDASMAVPFSQGPALDREPDLVSVLDCLASDAASVDQARSFDDWADELGFFPLESAEEFRQAEATYNAIERQSAELRELLGDDAFATLLYDTERL